jgi:hypothetical protein
MFARAAETEPGRRATGQPAEHLAAGRCSGTDAVAGPVAGAVVDRATDARDLILPKGGDSPRRCA